jgi:3-hydroxyacyl-CoA dehydrogenase
MMFADATGVTNVLTKVSEYRAKFGDHWKPSPLLERLAAIGRNFYEPAASKAGI